MPCCFASAPAAVGSRSPRPSARSSGCAARASRSRSCRSRPPATATGRALRPDRRARRLRQGDRGGAARGPDRRRRALRQGHDLDGHRRARGRRLSAEREDPRDALCGATGSGPECGSARRRSAGARSCSRSSRPCRSSRCAATSTRGCASARERGLDAIVLAACGLDRLGLADEIGHRFDPDGAAAGGRPGRARAPGARGRGGARRAGGRRGDAAARRGRAPLRRGRRRRLPRAGGGASRRRPLTALVAAEDGRWVERRTGDDPEAVGRELADAHRRHAAEGAPASWPAASRRSATRSSCAR